jgi:superfamily II helicase
METVTIIDSVKEIPEIYKIACFISASYEAKTRTNKDVFNTFNTAIQLKKTGSRICPDCIQTGRVYNLIVSDKEDHISAYICVEGSLLLLHLQMKENNDHKIAIILDDEILRGMDNEKLITMIYSLFEKDEFTIKIFKYS